MKKYFLLLVVIVNCLVAKAQVVDAEFFIDTDPGPGNGTAITGFTSGNTINFNTAISTLSLSNGFHLLSIRLKDASGKWGLFEQRGFYVFTATNVANIVAAEFFIDADPGAGNATSILPAPNGSSVSFVVNVSTASLGTGFHLLCIRTKDADGKWGLFEQRPFYVLSAPFNMGNITSAEYFLDVDPGPGNGSPLTITTGQTINQGFVIPIPANTSSGLHYIGIRFKDEWGLFESASFTVITNPLPLQWISLDGHRDDNNIILQWQTQNEVNVKQFVVERSSNSISFTKLDTLSAKNLSTPNFYSYTDHSPSHGVNFYRIQQIDFDGKISYSSTIKILFTDKEDDLKLYPNPAKDIVHIVFATQQTKVFVSLFDVKGSLIKTYLLTASPDIQLELPALTHGKYWLRISDDKVVKTKSFEIE